MAMRLFHSRFTTRRPSVSSSPAWCRMRIMSIEFPLTEKLTDELLGFWEGIFGNFPDITRGVLLGHEGEHNRNRLYMNRLDGKVAGTCLSTVSKKVPIIGGFGEVATAPELRRRGIATELCGRAVEEFRAAGGQALFLGTGEPGAARVYHRLGWRKLAGASVMANISSGDSPESFLVDYFRDPGRASVREASAEVRVTMIPLIVNPHDWQVLDANIQMYSTRYKVQNSCMGQYPRYEAVTREGSGAWFAAYAADNRVVGLSTVRADDSGGCRIDGFTHKLHLKTWDDLVRAAIGWGRSHGAAKCWAAVSVEDEEKQSMFKRLGFHGTGPAGEFQLEERAVASLRMELD